MNYYPRHIGDYQTATADLSMLEHGAYSMLLDAYYSRETPPSAEPLRQYQICKAMTKQERAAVDLVVARFFTPDGDVVRNRKADEVIKDYQAGAEVRRKNGKLGGRPRKPANNLAGSAQGTGDITENITGEKANPESITKNQNKTPLPPKGGSPKTAGISISDLSDENKISRWIGRQGKNLGLNAGSLPMVVAAAERALEVGDDPVGLFISLAKDGGKGDWSKISGEQIERAKLRLRGHGQANGIAADLAAQLGAKDGD